MGTDDGLRSDARENRERILRAAKEVLEADPGASLNSIAKAANVGPGTLYRHFPNRESLVLVVYRQEIDELAGLASFLLEQYQPLEAFRLWCDRLVNFGRMKSGFSDIIEVANLNHEFEGAHNPILLAVQKLMNASIQSGEILPDANLDDFLTLLGFLGKLSSNPGSDNRIRRLLAVIFRGLEAKPHSEGRIETDVVR